MIRGFPARLATLHYVLTGRDPEKFPPFSFPPVRDLRPEVSINQQIKSKNYAHEFGIDPKDITDWQWPF